MYIYDVYLFTLLNFVLSRVFGKVKGTILLLRNDILLFRMFNASNSITKGF